MPKIFLKIKRLQKYEILSTHSSHVKLSYVEGENLTKYTQTSSVLIRKPKKKKKKKKEKKRYALKIWPIYPKFYNLNYSTCLREGWGKLCMT
jgi:hypothetical protein